ncbi:MAG: Mth938-like domain-containing protein [Gammaproteobacteria bacterium]|nr:Mth938-like domain-containing protein [Gammaproteobacteria bacterium]
MNFSQDTNEANSRIHAYTEDYFVINEFKFDCHCQLHRDGLTDKWQPLNIADLQISDFKSLLDCQPEVLILGTGATLKFPQSTLRQQFAEHKIGLEVMDTGAACRTYNILLSEGRNVAAALLLSGITL